MNDALNKKMGVITFHSSLNEGAMLQAYGLTRFLQSQFPEWGVEIVDHNYPSKMAGYEGMPVPSRVALQTFCTAQLPLSKAQFISEDHTETFRYVQENYHCAITGSDEIWKFIVSSGGVQSNPFTPVIPNVYWADESITIPKIAYAATVAESDWAFLTGPLRNKLVTILNKYQLIGVRDTRTFHFLMDLCPNLMHYILPVPDPAFTLDIPQLVPLGALAEKLASVGVDLNQPMALMMNHIPQVINYLRIPQYQWLSFQETDFPSVNLAPLNLSPLEWAALPHLVDFGVTNRMHGAIAFILANKPCFVDDIRFKTLELCTAFRIPTYVRSLTELFALWPYHHIEHLKEEYVQQHHQFVERMRSHLR